MTDTNFTFTGVDFDDVFVKAAQVLNKRPEQSPRGLKTKELVKADMVIENPLRCILSNKHRKLSSKYLKAEFDWYLSGDLNITEIKKHASMWDIIKNPDRTVNSNYGYFVYHQKLPEYDNKTQFDWCVSQFIKDEDTRQALINFNQPMHKYSYNKDFVCTVGMQFLIRDNELISLVNMRSCDLIYGASFDIPWFAFVQYSMYTTLKQYYPHLKMGKLIHSSASLHIYERHYKMLNDVINDNDYMYISKNLFDIVDKEKSLNIIRG